MDEAVQKRVDQLWQSRLALTMRRPLLVKLDAIQVLALSCFGLVIGVALKRLFPALDELNIPAPIVGGLIYALSRVALRDRTSNFEMELCCATY